MDIHMTPTGFAAAMRQTVLEVIAEAGLGHIGGDFSVTEILATLYADVLQVDPANPRDPQRDRLVMSKGHAAVSLYTALAQRGFIESEELATFARTGSRLSAHPDRTKVPGVECNTGPLGHGLPIAVGMAIGAELQGATWRTFVILGDGELQEGSNWEAIMYAGHRKLTNLIAIVDRNGLQQGATTESTNGLEPLDARFAAFGWDTRIVDGHDTGALAAVLNTRYERPCAVIAQTVKGKGVSFMEGKAAWHHKVPDAEQLIAAREELAVRA